MDKHCGKNDTKELQVWRYKIGLNNLICNKVKVYKKMFL